MGEVSKVDTLLQRGPHGRRLHAFLRAVQTEGHELSTRGLPSMLPPLPDGRSCSVSGTLASDQPTSQPGGQFLDPIPGIIPFGTLTLFAGAPGVGKTAMLAEWCARWRDGRTICGKPTNPPTAFYYLAADRQWESHAQWFRAVAFPDIPYYALANDPHLNFANLAESKLAYKAFTVAVDRLDPIPGSHLFVDPVSPLFISGDPNRARDVAVSLLRISRVVQERQINISCTAHFGKQKTDPNDQYARPQDRIAGSGAFLGFSDTQIYLIDPQPPKQPYHVLGWTPRHAPAEEFQFTRDTANGLFVPFNLFKELDRIEAIILCVPFEPTHVNTIIRTAMDKTGLASAQVERYLTQLLREGRIVKVKRGWYKRAQPS